MTDAQSSPNTAEPLTDGHCFYCREMTNRYAGDPGLWPLQFCQPDGTGITRFHHTRCVTSRLATPSPGDVGELADEIDAALNDYLTNAGDALGSRLRRMRLEETLWDNKAGIVAYLRAAARSSAETDDRPRAFLAWAVEMFGPVAKLRSERLMRFLEEAVELAHADGMEYSVLAMIANRVYSRAPGDVTKEIGQAQACLETYAENIGESAVALAEIEWQRVQGIPQTEWQRRHAAKQAIGIALPASAAVEGS